MNLNISINMDNDAFRSGKKAEVRRIINEFFSSTKFQEGNSKTLIDINGNSVGKAEITR